MNIELPLDIIKGTISGKKKKDNNNSTVKTLPAMQEMHV